MTRDIASGALRCRNCMILSPQLRKRGEVSKGQRGGGADGIEENGHWRALISDA